jgi:hypothetical protein
MTAVIFRHNVTQNQVCGRVHEQTWKAKPIGALGMMAVMLTWRVHDCGPLSHG